MRAAQKHKEENKALKERIDELEEKLTDNEKKLKSQTETNNNLRKNHAKVTKEQDNIRDKMRADLASQVIHPECRKRITFSDSA